MDCNAKRMLILALVEVIRVEQIEKSYGRLKILQDINFEIQEGECVSILGPSGSGKSTLLYILGLIEEADSGKALIGDVSLFDLRGKALSAFRNQSLGFVFQFHHLLPEFSALENVCIPGFIARRSEREVRNKAKELLCSLGLEDRMTHRPKALSGGEQQRVAVARALINDPKVLLADEPTGNLDAENSRQMMEILTDLNRSKGQTILLVTHDDLVAKMAGRSLSLVEGKIT